MLKGGNIVTFELKGGIKSGQTFLNQIEMCSLKCKFGRYTRTIVTHPTTSTHSKLTPDERALVISDGLIRLSIGKYKEHQTRH